jgi:hypothetical protein
MHGIKLMKYVPPSTSAIAFNCPHCDALADQTWYSLHAKEGEKSQPPPRYTWQTLEEVRKQAAAAKQDESADWERLVTWIEQSYIGNVILSAERKDAYSNEVANLFISVCYSCDRASVWIHDKLVCPPIRAGIGPNEDLPADILRDFNEAREILDLSPRGAAALLRLAIQKLCVHLGEKGENLNADIGKLVAKGLDARVQKSLDIVRVVGNDSVHPGQIDLRDSRLVAEKLFGLVNLIAEKTISEPKHVAELYDTLVSGTKQDAIDARDKKPD